MKTLITLLTGVLILMSVTSQATVWRVNNLGYAATFTGTTALQDAIDSAAVAQGDTLHVEASVVTYGDVTLDKQLVLIGAGYKLGQSGSDNPNLQASAQTSKVGTITFAAFSESSIVSGLHFVNGNAYFDTGSGNYVVSRCYFQQSGIIFNNTAPLSQVHITQCYIYGGSIRLNFGTSSTQSNISITNNYLYGFVETNPLFSNNWVVSHNVFDGPYNIVFWDATIRDNIFNTTNLIPLNNNSFSHNLCSSPSATLPSGSENHDGLQISQICTLTGSDDAKWHLINGVNTTYPPSDDTERGIFGGNTPYKPSGIPAIPAIYQLSADPTAIQGEPLPVTISTRSNN